MKRRTKTMSPVIRIDEEVMEELKKRAVVLGKVFETPNTVLRVILSIDENRDVSEEATIPQPPNPPKIRSSSAEIEKTSAVVGRRLLRVQHPPVKSVDGKILAPSIKSFADHHSPPIKYTGMKTAIDVLTACKSPKKDKYGLPDYEFHYDIIAYKRDGVYIERKAGRGYRTSPEETETMRRQAGFKY
jgi:hypothetical protein